MPKIDDITYQKIKGYLEGFLENSVNKYRLKRFKQPLNAQEYLSRQSSQGDLKPFHAAILPPEIMRISAFERGFSTSLGSTFEEAAKLIALQHHKIVKRGYTLSAKVSNNALDETERQTNFYDSKIKNNEKKPSFEEMVKTVLKARKKNDIEEKKVQVDLYILSKNNQEYFFEIKSPKPNKGQCLEVIKRLLRFHLFREEYKPQVNAYYGMPYNPYGNKEKYKWTPVKKYTPFEEIVLLDKDFWHLIGNDEKTYQELLQIYIEVGREKSKYMLDSLAFELD